MILFFLPRVPILSQNDSSLSLLAEGGPGDFGRDAIFISDTDCYCCNVVISFLCQIYCHIVLSFRNKNLQYRRLKSGKAAAL